MSVTSECLFDKMNYQHSRTSHERIRLHAHILTYIIVSPLHAHQRNSSDRKMDGARGGLRMVGNEENICESVREKTNIGSEERRRKEREREATISSLRFLPSTATATIRTCAPNPLQLGIFLSLRLFAVKKERAQRIVAVSFGFRSMHST